MQGKFAVSSCIDTLCSRVIRNSFGRHRLDEALRAHPVGKPQIRLGPVVRMLLKFLGFNIEGINLNVLSPELGIETWDIDTYVNPLIHDPPMIMRLADLHCQMCRGRVTHTEPNMWITATMDRVSCPFGIHIRFTD
jgi:hypothetical protein